MDKFAKSNTFGFVKFTAERLGEADPMTHAVELYHHPLKQTSFEVAGRAFPLLPGLLSTIGAINRCPLEDIHAAARALGATTRKEEPARLLVQAYGQLRWWEAKGAVAPEASQVSFMNALKETQMKNDAPLDDASSPHPSQKGLKPYCMGLIKDGTIDPDELLRLMHAKFPANGRDANGKYPTAGAFKRGDVLSCLRRAGILPHKHEDAA